MWLLGSKQLIGGGDLQVAGMFWGSSPCSTRDPWRFGGSLVPLISGIQFQLSDVFLDPGLFGVSADLPVSLGQENDTRLGAKAAGLKIVSNEFSWNLPSIGEAAGSRGVSSICRGRDRTNSSHP